MPFTRPTLETLISRSQADIQARLPGTSPFLRRNLTGILARMTAGTAHGLYGYLDWLALQLMPDTAEAEHLERWASVWGVVRKVAARARGDLVLTGTPGAVAPEGTLLRRADAVLYRMVAETRIGEDGTASATVEAVEAGANGNATPGTSLVLTSPVEGIAVQTMAATGLNGGTAEEADAGLRKRLLACIRHAPMGGSLRDYETWALEAPGVTRAFASREMGRGTVTVRFMMDDTYPDGIPREEDRRAVAEHIEVRRPVTAHVYVVCPVPDPLRLRLSITPDTVAVRARAEAGLWAAVRRDAVPGGPVLLSRLREALSTAEGETDHVILAPTGNVTPAVGHIVVPGTVTWERS